MIHELSPNCQTFVGFELNFDGEIIMIADFQGNDEAQEIALGAISKFINDALLKGVDKQ